MESSSNEEKTSTRLYDKIREDVELCLGNHIINAMGNQEIDSEVLLQNLIENGEIKNITDAVYAKHESELAFRLQPSPDPANEDYWGGHGFMDTQNFSAAIRNLDRTVPLQMRISALDSLLLFHVLDTSSPAVWSDLLVKLRHCFCDKSLDVAQKSLRLHYKIISNNSTFCKGYINLIKAAVLLFKNLKRFVNDDLEIDTRNSFSQFCFKVLAFILKIQVHILKTWMHIRDEERLEIVNGFMQLTSSQLENTSDVDLKTINWISCLDPKAVWLRNFSQILGCRIQIFKYLKSNLSLLKYCISDVLNNLQNFNCARYLDPGIIFNHEILQTASFSHSLAVISIVSSSEYWRSFFPVLLKSHSEPVTLAFLIATVINGINNEYIGQMQRSILAENLLEIANGYVTVFKTDKALLRAIYQPFVAAFADKRHVSKIVKTNLHVLNVTRILLNLNGINPLLGTFENVSQSVIRKTKGRRRISLSEYPSSATSVESLSLNTVSVKKDFIPVQILFEIVDLCLRRYIVQNEHDLTEQNILVTELLGTCYELLNNKAVLLRSGIDFNKFMTRLCDFYKSTTNYRYYESLENRIALSRIIISLCDQSNYVDIILQDNGLLYELVGNVLSFGDAFWNGPRAMRMFLNVCNVPEGSLVVAKHQRQLFNPLLQRIWESDEDEFAFLTGSERKTSRAIRTFLRTIHALSFSVKTLRLMLGDDDKDTINEENDRAVYLSDLIDTALIFNGSGNLETFVALLTLQMLISNNADVLLYLENVYKLKEELLNVQVMNSDLANKEKVRGEVETNALQSVGLDECTLLRQNIIFILKNIGMIEKKVTEDVTEQMTNFHMQTNSAFKRRLRNTNELQRYLHDYRNGLHDNGWLVQARKVFKASCGDIYKPSLIFDLIEQVVKAASIKKHNHSWPTNDNQIYQLFPETYIGISSIISFGLQNNLLQNSAQNTENLRILLMQSQIFFKNQTEEFDNFDWFIGVVFLICSGNLEKSKVMLINLLNFASVPILWHNCNKYIYKKSSAVFMAHINHINVVLEDFGKLSAAFESFGIPAIRLTERWNVQSFFNILEFGEICNFIALCVLYPLDFIAYYNVSVLKHLQSKILAAVNNEEDSWNLLKLSQVDGYKLCNYINNMEKMGKKYKSLYVKI